MGNDGLTRRGFLGASAAGGLAALAAGGARSAAGEPSPRPNVLFINTDQQRADTLGCSGNPLARTPHLDALAARGALFTSCYATQPVCSPCRSSMVTGLFPNATSVVENNIPLPAAHFAWPRALRDAGYRTAYIGKWHLGVEPVPDYFDLWRGFNTGWKHFIKEEPFYAAPGESDSAFRERLKKSPPSVPKGERLVGKYRPDVEADYALAFLRGNRDRPFACWLSFYPPHTPKEAPKENIALYRDSIHPEEQAVYHAMVNRIDWNVGRVLAELDTLGLRERTLVVFTSDHGENYPFRWNNHHKRLCYDQAANVPLIVSLPGTFSGGRRVADPVSVADLCPTIADLCGVAAPMNLHGESLRPLLAGVPERWRGEVFIQNTPFTRDKGGDADMRERCVVTRDWKLILNTERPPELYDRRAAAPDTENLCGRPETLDAARALSARMASWAERTGDTIASALVQRWAEQWT